MLSRLSKQAPALNGKWIHLHIFLAARTFAAKADAPRLDAHGEPRFLEQVKLHFNNAAAKTGIDK